MWSKDTGFESVQKAELESALVGHFNGIAQKLASAEETYGPLLQEIPSAAEVSWGEWIIGFARAAGLGAGRGLQGARGGRGGGHSVAFGRGCDWGNRGGGEAVRKNRAFRAGTDLQHRKCAQRAGTVKGGERG